MSKYDGVSVQEILERKKVVSSYQNIMNQEPPADLLQDVEVIDDETKLKKTVKATRLNIVYELLDTIYQRYDTSITEIRLVGRAIIVNIKLETWDMDGVKRSRDGTGFVEAEKGVKHATAKAEANAIKNAAKKLGKVFGRDLYAEDDEARLKKLEAKAEAEQEDFEQADGFLELVKPAIESEEVNPVYTAILKQIQGVKSSDELKPIGLNMVDKAQRGDLDGDEFDHLTGLINKKINDLKNKKNGVTKSRNNGLVSPALHVGTTNKASGKNKRPASRRSSSGSSSKTAKVKGGGSDGAKV